MGFFEILIIAVVTLLVVGPDRMPEAVRTVALTIGRIKRSFNVARDEIEKQIGADDIRRQLHNEEVMASLEKMKSEVSSLDQKVDSGDQVIPYAEEDNGQEDEVMNPRASEQQVLKKQTGEPINQPVTKS